MYFCNNAAFSMAIQRTKSGFLLYINGECCGKYATAAFAADDVANFSTGYNPWDRLMYHCSYPLDISEWECRR